MKARFWMFRRTNGVFYCEDTLTGKQESLATRDRHEAKRLVQAKIEAVQQPQINLQIARAYLMASDPDISCRTWQHVMNEILKTKTGSTQQRWVTAIKDKPLDLIRNLPIVQTRAQHFLKVLETGTVSTNSYLRRMHAFALDMNWLPCQVIPKRQWPALRFKEKRAITANEHQRIIARERNPERKAFYELAWYLGASQSDLAFLDGEDIDWEQKVISFPRKKTGSISMSYFGDEVAAVLRTLPNSGPLFPHLRKARVSDRATEFRERCVGLGIYGVTLHSYRYAWAERAKSCGYPERFAQQALGHNSKAVHRAYAKNAKVRVPSLEEYERVYAERKIIPMKLQGGEPVDMLQFHTAAK